MKKEIVQLAKLPEKFVDLYAQLVNQDVLYTIKGYDILFAPGKDSNNWIAYFNPKPGEFSLEGSKTFDDEHFLFKKFFVGYYGIYDSSDWNRVKTRAGKIDTETLIQKISDLFKGVEKRAVELGVELELEKAFQLPFSWVRDRLQPRMGKLLDSVVGDGSVRGGMEIRFKHPTLKNWDKDMVATGLKYLKRLGYNHFRGTAGMHIHMSGPTCRDTRRAATRFTNHMSEMQKILYPICARRLKLRGVVKRSGRYGLGNDITRGYTYHNTLEIRVFEATTNPDVFYARLKFADYFMRFLMTDIPFAEFFNNMEMEDKLNYKFLVETDNPHAFGCGKKAALAKLNLGA